MPNLTYLAVAVGGEVRRREVVLCPGWSWRRGGDGGSFFFVPLKMAIALESIEEKKRRVATIPGLPWWHGGRLRWCCIGLLLSSPAFAKEGVP